MTITTDRRRRIKFFADHGAGRVGFRLVDAVSLADAEEYREAAEEAGRLAIRWETDDEADTSWADAETLRRLESGTYEILACMVTLEVDGSCHSAGLCGIVIDTATPFRRDPYARVVEAELVSELLAELGEA